MRNEKENRVLGRLGARELTPEEIDRAAGKESAHHTNVITVNPYTGHLDGDGA
ncbi:MAG: hypothetical protein WA294_10305 [Acidobacteriaceae bacterium]